MNTKQFIKNSFFLYLRSLVVFVISLFTSRIVLDALGVEDYGVYQVVIGIIGAVSYMQSSLQATSQRFLSFSVGKDDDEKQQEVFSSLLVVNLLFSVALFVVLQIVACFIFDVGLQTGVVDTNTLRLIVFITSVSVCIGINANPYFSVLMAHEHMHAIALIQIVGAFLRLGGCYLLYCVQYDRMIFYALILLVVAILERVIMVWVCRKRFPYIRYRLRWHSGTMREMMSFAGWTSLSTLAYMFRNHGTTIVLNIFFGPLLNAAMGIARQVRGAIQTLVQDFQKAYEPQIVKDYAKQDYAALNTLVFSGTKIAIYLLALFSVPLILDCSYILGIWLVEVPPYASVLVLLAIAELFFKNITSVGTIAIRATGNVKYYEMVYNTVELLFLPCVLLVLWIFPEYYVPSLCLIVFAIFSNIIKLFFMHKQIPEIRIREYFYTVVLHPLFIVLLSLIIPLVVHQCFDESLLRFIITSSLFVLIFISLIWLWGLTNKEKQRVTEIITSKLCRQ
jgi:O-antigen/teichoic acid export membrane protein